MQEAVDQGVNILVGRQRGDPLCQTHGNGVEPELDLGAFLEREHVRAPQRYGPRLRKPNVEGPEPEIGADRAVELLERGGGLARERASPEAMRACTASGEIDRRHAMASSGAAPSGFSSVMPSSRSFSARTRCERPYSLMKPAASFCWYTSSSPNVTNRSSYNACRLSRPTTAIVPRYSRMVIDPVTRSWVAFTKASYASRSVVHQRPS